MPSPSLGTGLALRLGGLFLTLLPSALLAADQPRPTPPFEGPSIPDPPRQGAPWTPPETPLPRFLVEATGALFESGMADPRDCDYRSVEVGDAQLVEVHAFVLPEDPEHPKTRFAVGWNGLVYPVFSLGDPADLDADIRQLADTLAAARKKAASDPRSRRLAGEADFLPPFLSTGSAHAASEQHPSPLKFAMLLRLGRADLAETLFAASTLWTPNAPKPDLTPYGLSFLSLARDWISDAYTRALNAHMRADDRVALDALRRVSAFRASAEARAQTMGFPRPDSNVVLYPAPDRPLKGPTPYFTFLGQLPDLLKDQERRASDPPRAPIPPRGHDPSARIAALVRDLDQIAVRQMSVPGMAQPGNSEVVRRLVQEGNPAVPPLLKVLESDDRLTRSATYGRGMPNIYRYIHPVYEPAREALLDILHTRTIPGLPRGYLGRANHAERQRQADAIRAFWTRVADVPLIERWYQTLADDHASLKRWMEAASGLVSSSTDDRNFSLMSEATWPMKGEPLRDRKNPSVSDLMARRVMQIVDDPDEPSTHALHEATQMAHALARWDLQAARPTLSELMTQCRRAIDTAPKAPHGSSSAPVSSFLELAELRARAGDRQALDDYADWLRSTSPEQSRSYLHFGLNSMFKLLWLYPDDPATQRAARWLFTDPDSPWTPLTRPGAWPNPYEFGKFFDLPLVVLPSFRQALRVALDDRAPAGTVKKNGPLGLSIAFSGRQGGMSTQSPYLVNELKTVASDKTIPFRWCDFVAWKLSDLDGTPAFQLFWPENRRDEAIKAIRDVLDRHGDHYAVGRIDGESGFGNFPVHLRFPLLNRPATPDDVRAGRAIFSLEDQGQPRMVLLPKRPIAAKWVALLDHRYEVPSSDGSTTHVLDDQRGVIWQAEEFGQGDTLQRVYGFVGHHHIARVPASDIEFTDDPFHWGQLSGGLDLQVWPPEYPYQGYTLGEPIVVHVRVRNRQGLDRSAPSELLRRSDDALPALRRGISPSLTLSPPRQSIQGGVPGEATKPLEPRPIPRFDPTDRSQTLGPAESFEAFSIDLTRWYDLSQPGRYQFHLDVSPDTGLGAGRSNTFSFQLTEPSAD